jgi:hypothetical protein
MTVGFPLLQIWGLQRFAGAKVDGDLLSVVWCFTAAQKQQKNSNNGGIELPTKPCHAGSADSHAAWLVFRWFLQCGHTKQNIWPTVLADSVDLFRWVSKSLSVLGIFSGGQFPIDLCPHPRREPA